MATDFVEALEGEIDALEAELQRDPRYVKLAELKRVRTLYAGAPASSGAVLPAEVSFSGRSTLSAKAEINPPTRTRRRSPERAAILAKAEEFLQGRNHPTLTADIYEAIKDQVEIGGSNPRNNLSAMLSNSYDFQSHGRAGWTLRKTSEASDDLISRSASEASNSSPASPAGEPDVRPVDPAPGGGG